MGNQDSIESKKADLEVEKLRLEIAILKRDPWRIGVSILVPIVAAALAAVVALFLYNRQVRDNQTKADQHRIEALVGSVELTGDLDTPLTSLAQLELERSSDLASFARYLPTLGARCIQALRNIQRVNADPKEKGFVAAQERKSKLCEIARRLKELGACVGEDPVKDCRTEGGSGILGAERGATAAEPAPKLLDAVTLPGAVSDVHLANTQQDGSRNSSPQIAASSPPRVWSISQADGSNTGAGCTCRYPTNIIGKAVDLRAGETVWLMVKSHVDGLTYPQPGPLTVEQNGVVQLGAAWPGTPKEGCEQSFTFILARASRGATKQLREMHRNFKGFTSGPHGYREEASFGPCKRRC